MIHALMACIGILGLGALFSLIFSHSPRILRIGIPLSLSMALGLGLMAVAHPHKGCFYSKIPLGPSAFHACLEIKLDPLSSFFLILILFLAWITAGFGMATMHPSEDKRPMGMHWFWFHILTGSMILIIVAWNGLLFLVAWELMSISSFFLIGLEHEKKEVRNAGLLYLILSHIGIAFLLFFFIVIGKGGLDFHLISQIPPHQANILFLCALIGFGMKAGVVPFHVWLPEAHPAAPSHISALMSTGLISMGIYGLMRSFLFLEPSLSIDWGFVIMILGMGSSILGAFWALSQRDLKRLLAYSSIENMGLIFIGIGMGITGLKIHNELLALLGFGAALLHTINHSLMKGLLFLTAGVIVHAQKTRNLEQLGGLNQLMPLASFFFIWGSMAICGLPPLNGFISEFSLFWASWVGIQSSHPDMFLVFSVVVGGVAFAGGLATLAFLKVSGTVILGHPRTEKSKPHPLKQSVKILLGILTLACLLSSILSVQLIRAIQPILGLLTQTQPIRVHNSLQVFKISLFIVTGLNVILMGALAILMLVYLYNTAHSTRTRTWDCGYDQPTRRMQYTPSSLVQPLTRIFHPFLKQYSRMEYQSVFPNKMEFSTQAIDYLKEKIYIPMMNYFQQWINHGKKLQHGRLQLYLIYVTLTLLILLIWNGMYR